MSRDYNMEIPESRAVGDSFQSQTLGNLGIKDRLASWFTPVPQLTTHHESSDSLYIAETFSVVFIY